jgi:pimeloyl-ACP methyl ester carboxylesterase
MSADAHWETIGPPPLGLFAREQLRAAMEFARFGDRRQLLSQAARGDGHPVLVLPGLLAGDASTAPLRRFLRALCYDARGWKLGINRGPTPRLRKALEQRLLHLAQRHGRGVSLVGWSLGGIYARELARAHPDRVRQVITLASPFRDISATHAARLVSLRRGAPRPHESADIRAMLRRPVAVPTTSIYSRSDGIVHWQSCLEQPGPQRENVEVHCSHTGMGWHTETLRIIADRLAQPEGRWRPYGAAATEEAPEAVRA